MTTKTDGQPWKDRCEVITGRAGKSRERQDKRYNCRGDTPLRQDKVASAISFCSPAALDKLRRRGHPLRLYSDTLLSHCACILGAFEVEVQL